jgi:hypothetical protein
MRPHCLIPEKLYFNRDFLSNCRILSQEAKKDKVKATAKAKVEVEVEVKRKGQRA